MEQSCNINKFMEFNEKEKAIQYDFGNMHKDFEGIVPGRGRRSGRGAAQKKALKIRAQT